MCGCMGNTVGWVYIAEDGTRTQRRTEVEAMALYYQNDSRGTVEPVKGKVSV